VKQIFPSQLSGAHIDETSNTIYARNTNTGIRNKGKGIGNSEIGIRKYKIWGHGIRKSQICEYEESGRNTEYENTRIREYRNTGIQDKGIRNTENNNGIWEYGNTEIRMGRE